ncbi:hypothetical protein ABNF97_23010 [Plantactinospora sp. B6F1]|uniref:hypothetical protein n=1 Tax=Plantactinospora sp. B6F1 TaxID=3158971 RepID=UPI00102B820B
MALVTVVTDNLDDVGAEEFLQLDEAVGALGCHGRLVQMSNDPRWEPRYVVVRDGPRLCAALPIYLGRGEQWSDQIHSPVAWGQAESPVPEKSALIGGRLEIRGSLRCREEPEVLRAVSDAVATVTELAGRSLYFGYLDPRQQRLAETLFGPMEWLAEYEDLAYPEEVVLGSPDALPSKVRHTIRADERQMAKHGITVEAVPWRDYRGSACDLIAAHNNRMQTTDHPALVRYRMDQWDDCAEVSVLVLHARAGDEEGVLTLLRFHDELEVYEVGLPEHSSPARRALYACLIFHGPRQVARSHGLRKVHAGLGTATPKRLRGAEAVARRCGRALRTPG